MIQILETEKIYVTPQLKKKKVFYKINFFVSVFLVCFLFSYYIYAEYDKTKAEEASRELLYGMTYIENSSDLVYSEGEILPGGHDEKDTLLIVLDEREKTLEELKQEIVQTETTKDRQPIGTIYIPKIDIEYPILPKTTDELMKISPTKYAGPDLNEVGNVCIAGHNYRNKKFFSKVPTLVVGDIISITDLTGRTITYRIYSMYEVDPRDTSCTSQRTNGRKEITLITCTDDNARRVIVKATEI